MTQKEIIIYCLDEKDEIVAFINDEWNKSADLSGDFQLLSNKFIGRSLWDFIVDSATRDLYRKILVKVRTGRLVRFNIRCDTASNKRLLELYISLHSNGDVQFESSVLELGEPAKPLDFTANSSKSEQILIVCSWCNRIKVFKDTWQDVDEAIISLRLFEGEEPPQLSHGICSECYAIVSENLD